MFIFRLNEISILVSLALLLCFVVVVVIVALICVESAMNKISLVHAHGTTMHVWALRCYATLFIELVDILLYVKSGKRQNRNHHCFRFKTCALYCIAGTRHTHKHIFIICNVVECKQK